VPPRGSSWDFTEAGFASRQIGTKGRLCPVVYDSPETRYTRSSDGTNLAYQISGDGPLELVFVPSPLPIDLLSDDPGFLRLRRRLDSFSCTVWFDARGMGSSEGDPRATLVGDVSDADLTAVLDAVGFERPALAGVDPGMAQIHFSATHPERVSALILVNSYAHYVREDDYPWGVPPGTIDQFVATVKEGWGTSTAVGFVAPSRSADQHFRAWYARAGRFGGSPNQFADIVRATFEADLRSLLPSISCPTLVVHRENNRYIRLGAGQYLAEHIPNAHLVVLPGEDHLFFAGDIDALADEIEEFLTGARSGAEGDVLGMAVLFTDIVASTEHQARVGPRRWSQLTDHHDSKVRSALARHKGHEVKTTGDGFLATFEASGRAIRCANEIVAEATDIGLELRVGIHTGEVEVRGKDIAGLAVTIAKRTCDLARPGEVLVTRTVTDHVVGSGVAFEDRGEHALRGVPGTWSLFAVKNLGDP
jgi:class 3 adenylate cyclase/pimeloyl-ACP methyl ester carboxylesterase